MRGRTISIYIPDSNPRSIKICDITDGIVKRIYIGEAENILTRIKQHDNSKNFWNLVICFVSQKYNINKAHIKYLENYACDQAKRINKCTLDNNTNPTQSRLTEQD